MNILKKGTACRYLAGRTNHWYLFPKNVDVEKLTKFYKSMHINVLSKILLSLQLFGIFGRFFNVYPIFGNI